MGSLLKAKLFSLRAKRVGVSVAIVTFGYVALTTFTTLDRVVASGVSSVPKTTQSYNQPIKKSELMQKAWGFFAGSGVQASEAQKIMSGNCKNSGVVVAVIDTGLDTAHTALRDSLWINTKEKTGKAGVDDDGNGLVDDIHGWDFARNSGVLTDSHGHGTHIAGIISGDANDADAYKGVCPGVQIMALRYYNPAGTGMDNLRNTIKAINYAVDQNVDIINYSGGGAEYSSDEYAALKRAEQKGIILIAAAGNEKSNADKQLYYPAAYPLTNVISVTAINERGEVLPSSNWGVNKVHVAAPGQSILSALPNGGYGYMTGTSQATAFVSGIAAMLLSQREFSSTKRSPERVAQLEKLIASSSQKIPTLIGKTKFGARVNAVSALKLLQSSGIKTQQSRALSSTR